MKTMNISAQNGDQVVFVYPYNGYTDDQKNAKNHLKIGQVYTVDRTEVGGSHADVFLKEVPGVSFNSVHFKDYTEKSLPPAA